LVFINVEIPLLVDFIKTFSHGKKNAEDIVLHIPRMI
jgi:hypothetical protein